MDASVAFYGSLFGWTMERGDEEFGGYSNFSKDGRLVGLGPGSMFGLLHVNG